MAPFTRLHAPLIGTALVAALAACAARPESNVVVYPPAKLDSTRIHSARSFLAAARAERAANNTPAAERLLTGLLEVHPHYSGAYEELVSLQLEVGNLSRAREALDQGLALDPGNRNLLRLDGAYYLAEGDLEQAHERYSSLASSDKLDAKAQLNLALVQVMRGEDAEALSTLVGPLGAERAKARLIHLQALRARSGQIPSWAPSPAPTPISEELLAEVEDPDLREQEIAMRTDQEPEPLDVIVLDPPTVSEPATEPLAVADVVTESEMEDVSQPAAQIGELDRTLSDGTTGLDKEVTSGLEDFSALQEEAMDGKIASETPDTDLSESETEAEMPAVAPVEEDLEESAADPMAALSEEPLELDPVELGDGSSKPVAVAALDAPPVVLPEPPAVEPEQETVTTLEPATTVEPEAEVAQVESKPVVEPEVIQPEPEPEPETPAEPFVSSQWRGLAQSKIEVYGVLAVQAAKGMEVQMIAGGEHIIAVDRYAPGPVWVMGPQKDWLVSPNARIRFLADGSVFAGSGEREEFPAPPSRPVPGLVWP